MHSPKLWSLNLWNILTIQSSLAVTLKSFKPTFCFKFSFVLLAKDWQWLVGENSAGTAHCYLFIREQKVETLQEREEQHKHSRPKEPLVAAQVFRKHVSFHKAASTFSRERAYFGRSWIFFFCIIPGKLNSSNSGDLGNDNPTENKRCSSLNTS